MYGISSPAYLKVLAYILLQLGFGLLALIQYLRRNLRFELNAAVVRSGSCYQTGSMPSDVSLQFCSVVLALGIVVLFATAVKYVVAGPRINWVSSSSPLLLSHSLLLSDHSSIPNLSGFLSNHSSVSILHLFLVCSA